MKKLNFLFALLMTLQASAQKNDSTLLNADREFASLSYKKGVANAFEKYLADDAVFLSSTPLPIEGKTKFMKLFADTKSTVIWQPTGSFKDKSDNSGYTYGLSKWIYPVADSLANSYYVYNTNWIKDSTNNWKVTTDIGSEISLKNYSLVSKSNFLHSKIFTPVIGKTITEKEYQLVYFTFESDRKGFVPAILVKPINKDINGTVVCYQHGIGKEFSKEYFMEEVKLLAEKGITSIMIDAPFQRKGESYIENGGMKDAELFENNCIEWLQVINNLPKLKINATNFIFVGHSYGGRIAAFMPYLDNRIKKVVILNGIYNYREWLQTSVTPQIAQLRKSLSAQDFNEYVKSVSPYDASIYLNKKNDIEFYFQAGTKDETLSEYDVLSCYEMTNSNKKIQWYNSKHILNEQAINDRIGHIMRWTLDNTSR